MEKYLPTLAFCCCGIPFGLLAGYVWFVWYFNRQP